MLRGSGHLAQFSGQISPARQPGGSVAGPAGQSIAASHTPVMERCESRPLSTLLGCGALCPQATPHPWGSLLPCAEDRPSSPRLSASDGSRDHTLFRHMEARQKNVSNLFQQTPLRRALAATHWPLPTWQAWEDPMASLPLQMDRYLLGSRAEMEVSCLGSLDRNSCLDSAEITEHPSSPLPTI